MENLIREILKLEEEHGSISEKAQYALQQLQKMNLEELQNPDMKKGNPVYDVALKYIILYGSLRKRLEKGKFEMIEENLTKEDFKNLRTGLLLYEALADEIKPYTNHPQAADIQLLKQTKELAARQDQTILKIIESFPTSNLLCLSSDRSKKELERLYRKIKKYKQVVHDTLFESNCLPDVVKYGKFGDILIAKLALSTYVEIDEEVQSGIDDEMQSLYGAVNVNLLQAPDSLEKKEYRENMLEMQKVSERHQCYPKVFTFKL